VSTLGSLAGVFAASHWLLPTLGTRYTFWLAGAGLLIAGALTCLVWRARGRELAPLLVIAALGGAGLVPRPLRPALAEGSVELARAESAYQTLRVVEDRSRDPVLRFLQVNEGFDSFQSVWQERTGLLPEGFYYNDFLLPLGWEPEVASWRVLVLGLGAGTVLRVFDGQPAVETEFVGIELDPEAVRLGQQLMGLCPRDPGREVWSGLDARVALACTGRTFDQIVLDCYANQIEIPPHLCTLEFFSLLRERLAVGGWFTANLGGFDFDDPVVAAVSRTCAAAFEAPVLLVRVPQSRNFVLLARRDAALPLLDGGGLGPQAREIELALGPRALPGFTRTVDPGPADEILTDDRCPMEALQLRSIEEARRRLLQGAGA
jgi:spermidine synthase